MKIDDLFDSENLESVERMIDFERVLAGMSERDQRIVALYAYGYTQVEIGVAISCDHSTVSRVLAKMHKTLEQCH